MSAIDESALRASLSLHRDEIIVYLARRFGSAEMAEAIVGEIMLRLRMAASAIPRGDARAYLFSFATQLGIDRLMRECAGAMVQHRLEAIQQGATRQLP